MDNSLTDLYDYDRDVDLLDDDSDDDDDVDAVEKDDDDDWSHLQRPYQIVPRRSWLACSVPHN